MINRHDYAHLSLNSANVNWLTRRALLSTEEPAVLLIAAYHRLQTEQIIWWQQLENSDAGRGAASGSAVRRVRGTGR